MRSYHAPRYSAVSWLDTLEDLRAAGVPILMESGDDPVFGLVVLRPFGRDTTMLKIKVDAQYEITAWEEEIGDIAVQFIRVEEPKPEVKKKKGDDDGEWR